MIHGLHAVLLPEIFFGNYAYCFFFFFFLSVQKSNDSNHTSSPHTAIPKSLRGRLLHRIMEDWIGLDTDRKKSEAHVWGFIPLQLNDVPRSEMRRNSSLWNELKTDLLVQRKFLTLSASHFILSYRTLPLISLVSLLKQANTQVIFDRSIDLCISISTAVGL